MSIEALKKLIGSSKATVLVAVVALLGVLLYTGKLTAADFRAAVQWLVGIWFVAHAGEEGAKAIAGRKDGAAPEPMVVVDGDDDE